MKFKASTLIETIIAMLIMSIVFLLSLSIVLNISKNNLLLTQYESYCIAYAMIEHLNIDSEDLKTETIEFSSFLIEKSVTIYNNKLFLIGIVVKNSKGEAKIKLCKIVRKSSL